MSVLINQKTLCEAREARLWTQEDLAAASGLSARTIQRIEAQGRCSKDSLQALSAALNMASAEFIQTTDVSETKKLNRYGAIGGVFGAIGGLTSCFIAGRSLAQNIQSGDMNMSLALLLVSFLTAMVIYSIFFPAFMIYRNWLKLQSDIKLCKSS